MCFISLQILNVRTILAILKVNVCAILQHVYFKNGGNSQSAYLI